MFNAIVMVEPAMCAHDKMMSTYVYFSWTCSIYIYLLRVILVLRISPTKKIEQ
jgi:hypothetical protein